MQLTQTGANSLQDTMAGRPMWVASEPGPPGRDDLYGMVTAAEGAKMMEPFVGPDSKLFYKVLDHDDIASVIDDFASAVVRAREAGVDGCELHAGHGYLIDGFLSPAKNHRTDEYGGPVETPRPHPGRDPAARSVGGWATTSRCGAGSTPPRTGPTATTLDDCITIARLAEAAGADAVHVSAYHDPASAIGPTESYAPQVPGLLIENARAVKARDRRAGDRGGPHHAGRGRCRHRRRRVRLRVDGPHDPRRAGAARTCSPRAGRRRSGRACTTTAASATSSCGARCAPRPTARSGREDELVVGTAARPARCSWSAAGPAGMEAARVAALRGHSVTLVDAAPRLGGRWAYAAATSDVNADLLRWLEHQLELRGVTVRLGERVDADGGARRGCRRSGRRHRRALGPSRDARCRPSARAHGRRPRPVVARRASRVGDDVVVLGGDLPGLGIAEQAARPTAHGSRCSSRPTCSGCTSGCPAAGAACTTCAPRGIVLAGGADVSEITAGRGAVARPRRRPRDAGRRGLHHPRRRSRHRARRRAPHAAASTSRSSATRASAPGLLEHAMRTALETGVAL